MLTVLFFAATVATGSASGIRSRSLSAGNLFELPHSTFPSLDGVAGCHSSDATTAMQGGTVPCQGQYANAIQSKGAVGSDGIRNFSFRIDPGITGAKKDTILQAVYNWNLETSQTKVRFVTDGWWGDDMVFKSSSTISDCGEWDPNTDDIYLHDTLLNEATNSPGSVEWVAGHEMGHVLGLDHGGSGAMSLPSNTTCNPQTIATWGPNPPNSDDAISAKDCIDVWTDPNRQFPDANPPSQRDEYSHDEASKTCYHIWYTYTVWSRDSIGIWYVHRYVGGIPRHPVRERSLHLLKARFQIMGCNKLIGMIVVASVSTAMAQQAPPPAPPKAPSRAEARPVEPKNATKAKQNEVLRASGLRAAAAITGKYEGIALSHPEGAAQSLARLVADTPLIFVGRIEAHQSFVDASERMIHTTYRVHIEEILKGPSDTKTIFVAVRGGRVGFPDGSYAHLSTPQMPLPMNAQRYVFFVEPARFAASGEQRAYAKSGVYAPRLESIGLYLVDNRGIVQARGPMNDKVRKEVAGKTLADVKNMIRDRVAGRVRE